MKQYEMQVLANQTVYVSAKNKRQARVKARKKFMKNPGRLEMYIIMEID